MTEKIEPSYQHLGTGEPTTADDPERGVWYAVNVGCSYWTDDWSKLNSRNGIPCCPSCGCPGCQITAGKWFDGARKYEEEGNPAYYAKLLRGKETCKRAPAPRLRFA